MAKKLTFFTVLVVLFFVLGQFIFNKSTNEKISKSNGLPNDKTNIELEAPQLKDNPNLARFYLWTREDPLFTSPDLNSESFLEAVNALELEEKAYLSFLKKNERIFPISFLKDIVTVSIAHNNFVLSPSVSNGNKLISAYKKTQEDYEKELRTFVKSIQSSKDIDSNVQFMGLSSSTNVKIIISDFTKLEKNAEELKNEIVARENCLKDGIGCKRPASFLEKPVLPNEAFSFSKNEILPLDLLFNSWMTDEKGSGPYIASTGCFGQKDNKDPYYLFYVLTGREKRTILEYKKKLNTQTEKIATEIFYRKIGNELNTLDEPLVKRGISMMRYYETNIYTCVDSSYKNKLAALDKFYLKYKENRLFDGSLNMKALDEEVRGVFEEGALAEKKFFDSEFPADTDAEYLARYYGYVYGKMVNWGIEGRFQGKEWFRSVFSKRDEFITRYLEYTRRMGNVDEILAETVGQFSGFRIRTILGNLDNFSYALPFRNMYGLTYMPFSRSFYRLPEQLTYINKDSSQANDEKTITYKKAISKYPLEEIKKWNIDLTSFIEEDYQKFKDKK